MPVEDSGAGTVNGGASFWKRVQRYCAANSFCKTFARAYAGFGGDTADVVEESWDRYIDL